MTYTPFKMRGPSLYNSPAKQGVKGPEDTEVIQGIKEAKFEDEGQQIIGRVNSGEISQEEGNRLLSIHQEKVANA